MAQAIIWVSIGIALAAVVVGFAVRFLYTKVKRFSFWSTENSLKNKRKERAIFRKIIKDIKQNRNDWTYISTLLSDFASNVIYNDKKNIALAYDTNRSTLRISLNVTAEDLNGQNPSLNVTEGIQTVVASGFRSKVYIRKIEKLVDRREMELQFFSDALEEKFNEHTTKM